MLLARHYTTAILGAQTALSWLLTPSTVRPAPGSISNNRFGGEVVDLPLITVGGCVAVVSRVRRPSLVSGPAFGGVKPVGEVVDLGDAMSMSSCRVAAISGVVMRVVTGSSAVAQWPQPRIVAQMFVELCSASYGGTGLSVSHSTGRRSHSGASRLSHWPTPSSRTDLFLPESDNSVC